MRNANRLRLAGIVGILGMFLGVAADVASGYSPQGSESLTSVYAVFGESVYSLLSGKPHWHFVLGHYLALLGIPLGILGLWHAHAALKPAGRWLSSVILVLGILGYVIGVSFHGTFSFLGTALRSANAATGQTEQALWDLISLFEDFTVPLAWIFIATMLVVSALIAIAIAFRETRYPRWAVLATPIPVQLLLSLLAFVAPPRVRVLLVVTAYNASLLVFYGVSTAVLWRSQDQEAP
jgi:hypothetical protein